MDPETPSTDYHIEEPKVKSNKYVYPDMLGMVPKLWEYCTGQHKATNSYHCKNLYDVLFQSANVPTHENDKFFNAIAKENGYLGRD